MTAARNYSAENLHQLYALAIFNLLFIALSSFTKSSLPPTKIMSLATTIKLHACPKGRDEKSCIQLFLPSASPHQGFWIYFIPEFCPVTMK